MKLKSILCRVKSKIRLLNLFVIRFFSIVDKSEKVYFSIGAIVKNEADYIKEWIDYHILIGVERFYIYDNESTDDTLSILKEYIDKGVVVYNKIKGSNKQSNAYNKIIFRYGKKSKWIAFIDVDEFIMLKSRNQDKVSLKSFFKEYEEYNGVGINWILFGTSGIKKKPKGLVIENYTSCLREQHYKNKHIKSIVNTDRVKINTSPHTFAYKDGKPVVDEDKEYIYGNEQLNENYGSAFSKVNKCKKIALHHYYTKSEEEFLARCIKGKASGKWDANKVFEEGMAVFTEKDLTENYDMHNYIHKLKNI